MKLIFSILLFFALLPSSSAKTIKVIGTFTDFENKQQEGEFLIPVQYINKEIVYRLVQWRVLFQDSTGLELQLTPANCKGFEFFYKDKWKKFVSVDNVYEWPSPFGDKEAKIFLEAKVLGTISFLNYYRYKQDESIHMGDGSSNQGRDPGGGGGRVKPQSYFYKNSRLTAFDKSNWRKQIKKLIWKEHDLAEQLNQIKKKQLVEFLERYNREVSTTKKLKEL